MKICLYSPYVPQHVGGGEKYFFDVARTLAEKHDVVVMIPDSFGEFDAQDLRQQYEQFVGASLAKVAFISGPLGTAASWWKKLWWTQQFDVMYYVTDGSLFFSLAKKNIVHIQIPFTAQKSSLIDRFKLANWEIKNTNSQFTKQVIEKAWRTKVSAVHWPMIEVPTGFSSSSDVKKNKSILHVGRFFTHQHTKRQDALVSFFKQLVDSEPVTMKGWKLILIGSIEKTPEDQAYAEEVRAAATGYPIEILHSVSRRQLWELYRTASIYWHATGYEVDDELHPEKVEHFGISTVEAMAMGCAPVVINKGGQPEVVGKNLSEWLWTTEAECLEKTLQLIKEPAKLVKAQSQAKQQATQFSAQTFKQTLSRMLGEAL